MLAMFFAMFFAMFMQCCNASAMSPSVIPNVINTEAMYETHEIMRACSHNLAAGEGRWKIVSV